MTSVSLIFVFLYLLVNAGAQESQHSPAEKKPATAVRSGEGASADLAPTVKEQQKQLARERAKLAGLRRQYEEIQKKGERRKQLAALQRQTAQGKKTPAAEARTDEATPGMAAANHPALSSAPANQSEPVVDFWRLGDALWEERKFTEALAAYEQLAQQPTELEGPVKQLSLAVPETQTPAAPSVSLSVAQTSAPVSSALLYRLALAYEKTGQNEKARRCYQQLETWQDFWGDQGRWHQRSDQRKQNLESLP